VLAIVNYKDKEPSEMRTIIDSEFIQWNPPENLVDHLGQVLSSKMVFFTSPPPEIGEIISASSSMSIGKKILQRHKGYKRKAFLAIATLALLVFGFIALANLFGPAVLAAIAIIIVRPIIALNTGYIVHSCSFVGNDGFSLVKWDRRKQACKCPEIFLFKEAASFKSLVIHADYLPIYYSSVYSLAWKDAKGKLVWSRTIQFRRRKGVPPLHSLYYFYQSAENAWKNRQNDLEIQELSGESNESN
jgi:hypothetical protein